GKRMTESVLREIEGVGKVKSASLIKKFGSVENIRRATVEEIASVDGFSINSAEKLKQNLETALADKNK
ncbi:MAG: excinuclease ABC subunit UvrC, partial [Clostridia bacterium]|nr:excinuclease ABC subunit UvrC [Clostridia bacterium]